MLKIRVSVMELGRFTIGEAPGAGRLPVSIMLQGKRERNRRKKQMDKENGCGDASFCVPHSRCYCLAVRARFAEGSKQALTHLEQVRLLRNRPVGCELVDDRRQQLR